MALSVLTAMALAFIFIAQQGQRGVAALQCWETGGPGGVGLGAPNQGWVESDSINGSLRTCPANASNFCFWSQFTTFTDPNASRFVGYIDKGCSTRAQGICEYEGVPDGRCHVWVHHRLNYTNGSTPVSYEGLISVCCCTKDGCNKVSMLTDGAGPTRRPPAGLSGWLPLRAGALPALALFAALPLLLPALIL
eukprot:NODE_2325_length_801_cov_133.704787_g1618_i0.p1 GENE.NODE_2325_length_801_cov_133.704787_g1618_i0~~NODE_2325_length_801_cov_133.704787_g1618_i0.p1  ORF type:complete len:193 (+),score=36.09 NODE_2325_length_801_cov_133.704787_g1618_i0:153-731(+)